GEPRAGAPGGSFKGFLSGVHFPGSPDSPWALTSYDSGVITEGSRFPPRRGRCMRTSLPLCLLLALAPRAAADPPDRAGVEVFEQKIRPGLVERCSKCHSAGAKKQRGGLSLDTRAAVLKGGDTGPALVPGKPDESLLLKALRHADESLKMPPDGRLPEAVVADFRAWIAR